MKEQYTSALNNIKAPTELVERTRYAMGSERGQKKNKIQVMLLAACMLTLLIGVYGLYQWQSRNQIHIGMIAQNDTSMSLEKNLGVSNQEKQILQEDTYQLRKSREKSVAPDTLWEVEPSRFKGKEVRIAKVYRETTYCAVFQKEDLYYYIEYEQIKEKEFIKFIKDFLFL